MTKAEIIQEIHKRATAGSPWPVRDHLWDLIDEARIIPTKNYRQFPNTLLNLAAQIVRVLEVKNENQP